MQKHITNEQTDIRYTLVGDYYIPDLTVPEEQHEIGRYGMIHLKYLKEHRRLVYTELLIPGRLNEYLHNVDSQTQEMFERLVTEYAEWQGITEQLKTENQMEWVGRMNNIRNTVEEIILNEVVYR